MSLPGSRASGFLRNDRVGVEDRLDALQADRGLGDDVSHLREILHRLEELVEVGKEHRHRADRHGAAEHQPRPAPEHESHAERNRHRDEGREQRLHPPGFERRPDGFHAGRVEPAFLRVLAAEGFDRAHGFQALLQDAHDAALALAHLVGGLFHRLLEPRDEQQQERRHAHSDEGEIKVEVEHHADHADDGQRINQDAEQRRRGEVLDRAHVVGDRAQHIADLVGVVILEREALEMMVEAMAQVVRHILGDALGVVIVNVARDRADQRNKHRAGRRHAGQRHGVLAERKIPQPPQKLRQLVLPDHVIENDLQRPRRGDAHRRLEEHRDEDDDQPSAIRPDEFEHQAGHALGRLGGILGRGGWSGTGRGRWLALGLMH